MESGGLDGRVERVDRVEIFMQASRSHSSIIYSRSSTEGSDTFSVMQASRSHSSIIYSRSSTEGSDTFSVNLACLKYTFIYLHALMDQ